MSITINIPTRDGVGIVVALYPRGDWDSVTAYSENDMVQNGGSSYYATAANTNSEPPSVNWQVLAARGPSGGDVGWSPVIANVADGARRVLQVSDWTGGTGTKPATGRYIGVSGLVTDIADGVDARGAAGAAGADGAAGSTGATGSPGWTAPSAMTYGATVTPDLNTAKAFSLTATGNFTLANPTNQSNGATFVIRITQDATGSRACTFGSAYKFAGGTPPLLSIAAGAVDTLSCIVWGTDDIEAWLSNNMKRNP